MPEVTILVQICANGYSGHWMTCLPDPFPRSGRQICPRCVPGLAIRTRTVPDLCQWPTRAPFQRCFTRCPTGVYQGSARCLLGLCQMSTRGLPPDVYQMPTRGLPDAYQWSARCLPGLTARVLPGVCQMSARGLPDVYQMYT